MNFQDFIRRALGINRINDSEQNHPSPPADDFSEKFRGPIWKNEGTPEGNSEDHFRHSPAFSFHVFTNPLEIHRYFEQQLEEFMKGFQQEDFRNNSFFGEMGPSLDSIFGGFNDSVFSGPGKFALPPPESGEQSPGDKNLREFFLKPQYEPPRGGPEGFKDSDLDGKIDPKHIGEILSRPSDPFRSFSDPSSNDASPHISSFGRSVTSRTMRRPDGTIETCKTVKDSQGKEETTTTYQIGDQSYSITILRDANGEEKRIENFVNIDEDKIPNFKSIFDSSKPMLPPPNQPGPPAGGIDDFSYWINKFFKN